MSIGGVIFGILLIIYFSIKKGDLLNGQTNNSVDKSIMEIIKEIALGENKEYLDECLGVAYYQRGNGQGITENIYLLSDIILRAYFKENQLVAYFVTLTGDVKIEFPKQYQSLVNYKEFGDFSYYEIYGMPSFIDSYATNGSGHVYYGEGYYFAAFGDYNSFYFLQLDYGVKNIKYVSGESFILDDEIDEENLRNFDSNIACARKESYPNTYGISLFEYADEVYEMIFSYNNYDFSKLYR